MFVTVRVVAERGPHGSFRIEVQHDQVFAVCACGWRSAPAMNAGLAGALWDKHRDEANTER